MLFRSISRPDFRGTDRALAAQVIVKERGGAAAKELIDIAKKPTTQAVLRNEIAALLSGLEDEKVDKLLLKLVGKGKGAQKAFAIRATSHIRDDKLTKKIRKGIRDKDPLVAIATIDALAARKDRDSIEDLEKLLAKTKDDDVRQAVLRGLSFIYDGENAWVERLKEYGGHEDLDLRNAALNEIRRLGRRNTADLFRERLSHPAWSTRLIALHALEDQRDVALLGPIVEQMQSESGRMSIEFGDTLFRLTGEPFGDSAAVWKRWFDNEGKDAKIIDESEVESLLAMAEERRLKAVSGAEFFGIRIESHRVAFVVDVSGSLGAATIAFTAPGVMYFRIFHAMPKMRILAAAIVVLLVAQGDGLADTIAERGRGFELPLVGVATDGVVGTHSVADVCVCSEGC